MALNTVSSDRLSTNVKASNLNSGFGQLGNRNSIINGAMQVAQRGTSDSGITSTEFADGPDRFKLEGNNFGTVTVSQATDSPDGFSNSYKVLVTATTGSIPAAGSLLEIVTALEGQDVQAFAKGTSAAKQYSLSFYVKTDRAGTYVAMLQDHDNSRMCCKTYTVSDANWNRYTLTYPADTTGAFGNDQNKSLSVKFVLVAGTDFTSGTLQTTWGAAANATSRGGQVNFINNTNYWQVTGVQLEVGSTATDFEHKSYGDELRRCQRYYWKLGLDQNAFIFSGIVAGSQNEARVLGTFPVPMRAAPSLTYSSLSFDSEVTGSYEAVNAIHAADLKADFGGRIKFGITTTAASNGAPGHLYPTDDTGYLQGDSEL